MGTYINADWTIVGTDSALHTARRVGHDLPGRENSVLIDIPLKNPKK
jgi:hypothetical protein